MSTLSPFAAMDVYRAAGRNRPVGRSSTDQPSAYPEDIFGGNVARTGGASGGGGAAGGPALSGWAQATGRPFRTNESGSITMLDQPSGPGVAPRNRNLFPGAPRRVTETLQAAINRGGSGGGSGGGDIFSPGQVLRSEVGQMQGAADRQFARNNQQIQEFSDFLDRGPQSVFGTADASARGLEGEAGRLNELGDQAVGAVGEDINRTRGNLDRDLEGVFGAADRQAGAADEALGYARRAESAAASAVAGYDADSQAALSANVFGLERRMQNQRRMVDAGMNPDGTRMTPQEQQAARRQLEYDTSMAVSQTVAAVQDQHQTTLANLRMGLSNARLGAGQVALGAAGQFGQAGELRERGASLRSEVGVQTTNQRMQAEQVRQGYRQMGAGLLESAGNMRNQARALAVQLESSGRTELANMVRNNPESVVSLFSGLLQLMQIQTAPGGEAALRRGVRA